MGLMGISGDHVRPSSLEKRNTSVALEEGVDEAVTDAELAVTHTHKAGLHGVVTG